MLLQGKSRTFLPASAFFSSTVTCIPRAQVSGKTSRRLRRRCGDGDGLHLCAADGSEISRSQARCTRSYHVNSLLLLLCKTKHDSSLWPPPGCA
jgi:hypothetical protein